MPRRSSSKATAAPLSSEPRRWAVCPRPIVFSPQWLPKPRLYAHQNSAVRWLRKPDRSGGPADTDTNSSSWYDPVPVERLQREEPAEPFSGQRFTEFLRLEDLAQSLLIDKRHQAKDYLTGFGPKFNCYLSEEWDFDEIVLKANATSAYRYQGKQVDGSQAVRMLHALENSLFQHHSQVSARQLARFWSSWQVFLHVFETVRDLTHNKHYQSREDSDRSNLLARIEGPRYFLLKEISLYVSEQLTADLGHQEASSRQEAFPRSVDNKKAADRVREHIDKSGLTQTQFAGKAGMTDKTVHKFLKTGRIKRNKLDDIAKAMNTSPTELLQD